MSSANLTALRFVAESTPGTTPSTPVFTPFRYTGESLNYNIENVQTAEIEPSRLETDLVQVQASAAGDLNFELSYGTFDAFIEAALGGTWTVGAGDTFTLDIGTTMKSFTVQKHFQDMTVPQFHNFTGAAVDGWSLRMEVGRIVEGSFSMMAFGANVSTSQIAGATFNAASTTTPMNAVTNLQSFSIAGVPYTGCISSIGLNLRNNIRARRCVGSLNPTQMKYGRAELSGSMEFYFNEGSNYAAFVAGTEFAVSWNLVDPAGNSYNFAIPRAKFETGQVVAGGLNTDVMFSATWRALKDSVTGRVVRITRNPV